MTEFDVLGKGILAGFAISAPVGPVNVFCISRALEKGPGAGFRAGLGAALADTIYGAIAGFSVPFVIGFLFREELWIRLAGGFLLIAIGVRYYFRPPRNKRRPGGDDSAHSDSAGAFLLNLTNPTTVLSFLAVLSLLGLPQHGSPADGAIVVAGIFAGAMMWWISVTAVAGRLRTRLTERAIVWMNRVAGIAIGAFGLVTVGLSGAF